MKFHQSSETLDLEISFYPYAGLNNTIRLHGSKVKVRISDLLQTAPFSVHNALAAILVYKLFKKRVPEKAKTLFRSYVSTPEVRKAIDDIKRERGYKQITSAQGNFYDLEKLFHCLNQKYFNNLLPQPTLSWSRRHTRRTLGHHDRIHNAIIISRSLDSRSVPPFFIEYILYHEMLHVKHKSKIVSGRCYHHTREFFADEKRFEKYREALEWLPKFRRLKRK